MSWPITLLDLLLVVIAITYAPSAFGFDPNSKTGLAWPNQLWVPMAGFTASDTLISSYYNWSPSPQIPSNRQKPLFDVPFPFIPMLWGCNSTYTAPFQKAVEGNFSNVMLTNQRDILGFNEPEITGQSECTPQEAVDAWLEYLEPLKAKGYRLGSPAVTSGDFGREWFREWWRLCDGRCNPDFIPVHWYSLDSGDFTGHLRDFHSEFNRPIWVTEYAVHNFSYVPSGFNTEIIQADYSDIQIFMDVTRSFMESVDWVERYFWFGAMYEMQGVNPLNSLFDLDQEGRRTGALSELGVQYAGSNGTVPDRDRWGNYNGAERRTCISVGWGGLGSWILPSLLLLLFGAFP